MRPFLFVAFAPRPTKHITVMCSVKAGGSHSLIRIMLSLSEKQKIVEELTERFRKQKVSIFADIHGIAVAKLTQFRRELKNVGAELKVAKKTLLARALEAVKIGIEPKTLAGELGVIFGYGDQIAPAKAAAKFAKENETFKVLAGFLEGKIMAAGEVLAFSRLPSRVELLGELAWALEAPLQNLATVLQGNLRNLVVVLSQIKKVKSKK